MVMTWGLFMAVGSFHIIAAKILEVNVECWTFHIDTEVFFCKCNDWKLD